MAMVLTDDEKRSLHDEPEIAMFERTAVSFADQEADQALVAFAHLVRRLVEGDARAVDDREVGRERAVERDEAVIEDRDDVLG